MHMVAWATALLWPGCCGLESGAYNIHGDGDGQVESADEEKDRGHRDHPVVIAKNKCCQRQYGANTDFRYVRRSPDQKLSRSGVGVVGKK